MITWVCAASLANYAGLMGGPHRLTLMVLAFLYPMRNQMMEWLNRETNACSPLGMLGGGCMAMVVTFLLSPAVGVLGNWDFTDFPTHLWRNVAFGIIVVSLVWYLVVKNAQKSKGINVDYAFKEIPPE